MGCDPHIFLMPWRTVHHFGFHILHVFHKPRLDTSQRVCTGGEDKFAHYLWMPYNSVQGNTSTHAIAKEISRFKPQFFNRSRSVISQSLQRQRAINICRMSMGLQLEGDHLTSFGEFRNQSSKRSADA